MMIDVGVKEKEEEASNFIVRVHRARKKKTIILGWAGVRSGRTDITLSYSSSGLVIPNLTFLAGSQRIYASFLVIVFHEDTIQDLSKKSGQRYIKVQQISV